MLFKTGCRAEIFVNRDSAENAGTGEGSRARLDGELSLEFQDPLFPLEGGVIV